MQVHLCVPTPPTRACVYVCVGRPPTKTNISNHPPKQKHKQVKTEVKDALLHDVHNWGYHELLPHQDAVIVECEALVDKLRGKEKAKQAAAGAGADGAGKSP